MPPLPPSATAPTCRRSATATRTARGSQWPPLETHSAPVFGSSTASANGHHPPNADLPIPPNAPRGSRASSATLKRPPPRFSVRQHYIALASARCAIAQDCTYHDWCGTVDAIKAFLCRVSQHGRGLLPRMSGNAICPMEVQHHEIRKFCCSNPLQRSSSFTLVIRRVAGCSTDATAGSPKWPLRPDG